jgi:hypothetical protein
LLAANSGIRAEHCGIWRKASLFAQSNGGINRSRAASRKEPGEESHRRTDQNSETEEKRARFQV